MRDSMYYVLYYLVLALFTLMAVAIVKEPRAVYHDTNIGHMTLSTEDGVVLGEVTDKYPGWLPCSSEPGQTTTTEICRMKELARELQELGATTPVHENYYNTTANNSTNNGNWSGYGLGTPVCTDGSLVPKENLQDKD